MILAIHCRCLEEVPVSKGLYILLDMIIDNHIHQFIVFCTSDKFYRSSESDKCTKNSSTSQTGFQIHQLDSTQSISDWNMAVSNWHFVKWLCNFVLNLILSAQNNLVSVVVLYYHVIIFIQIHSFCCLFWLYSDILCMWIV